MRLLRAPQARMTDLQPLRGFNSCTEASQGSPLNRGRRSETSSPPPDRFRRDTDMLEEKRPCTILHCPQLAIAYDQCEIADWTLRVFFCKEHQRQLNGGTPMGGLGLDPMRIEIT